MPNEPRISQFFGKNYDLRAVNVLSFFGYTVLACLVHFFRILFVLDDDCVSFIIALKISLKCDCWEIIATRNLQQFLWEFIFIFISFRNQQWEIDSKNCFFKRGFSFYCDPKQRSFVFQNPLTPI